MKRIIIWGASGRGKEIMYLLDEHVYQVIGFVDNDSSLWGKNIWGGVSINNPQDITTLDYDYIIISIPEHKESIMEQLKSVGVSQDAIIVWNNSDVIERMDCRIGYLRACADRLKEIKVPGACAEVGVYKGEFAKWINFYLPDRKLYLFDTFDGFGEQKLLEEEAGINQVSWQFQDTSQQEVLSKMQTPENCIVKKGFFPDTAEGVKDTFAFVSLDADLYEPILEGLKFFYPRMEKGGYIFVHDYGAWVWPGAKKSS